MKKFRNLVKLVIRAWYYKDNPKAREIWLRLQAIWGEINSLYYDLCQIIKEIRED